MLNIAKDVLGRSLRSSDGRTVGRVTAVYRYPPDMAAPWGVAAVVRGVVFRSTHLVDLRDARVEKDAVVAVYPVRTIKAAPFHEAMLGDTLADGHAKQVLSHYGVALGA